MSIPEIQLGLVKKLSYHCSEKPLGGNSRYFEALKEIGITMKIGRIRKRRMRPQMISKRITRIPSLGLYELILLSD
jgi:hypothetical protein